MLHYSMLQYQVGLPFPMDLLQKLELLCFSLLLDAFWLEVESFQDAGGNHCFTDLAQCAVKLCTLPISNALVERAFFHN